MRADEPRPVAPAELPRHMGSAPLALGRAKWKGMARLTILYGVVFALGAWHVQKDMAMARMAEALERATDKVVYHQIHDDGTITATSKYRELPLAFQRDNVHNALWDYVFNQDCYSASHAVTANYRIQKMSSRPVREQWKAYMTPHNNPESPQVRLGKKGHHYRCREIGMEFRPGGQDTYGMRFERVEVDARGNDGPKETMYASLVYRTGIHDPDDKDGERDRAVFNAPGVQVIQYVRARPEGTSSQRVVEHR